MHELSLASAIAEVVTRRALGRGVSAVHVRVGQLRQVVPDSLEFCWAMLTSETGLDGTTLVIERVAGALQCKSCSAESAFDEELMFVCPTCGSFEVDVIAGDEFDVVALDLVRV